MPEKAPHITAYGVRILRKCLRCPLDLSQPRWLRCASAGGCNSLQFLVGVLATFLLSAVHLLSERPWRSGKELPLNRGKHKSSTSKNYPKVTTQRHYVQYVFETVWAGAAGAAVRHWLS